MLHPFMLQVLKLLEEAVNAGFSAALNIDSTSVESLLGLGDAHIAAGKLLARSGNLAIANTHWKRSSEAFLKASKLLAEGNLCCPFVIHLIFPWHILVASLKYLLILTIINLFLLIIPDREYKYKLSFEEQCDALYNLACAAALAGQEADAAKALNQLVFVDAISGYDLTQDADLESLRSKDWFTALLKDRSSSSTIKE